MLGKGKDFNRKHNKFPCKDRYSWKGKKVSFNALLESAAEHPLVIEIFVTKGRLFCAQDYFFPHLQS